MDTRKKKQHESAQKVLSNGAKFSGWLCKEERKITFNNKRRNIFKIVFYPS